MIFQLEFCSYVKIIYQFEEKDDEGFIKYTHRISGEYFTLLVTNEHSWHSLKCCEFMVDVWKLKNANRLQGEINLRGGSKQAGVYEEAAILTIALIAIFWR